MAISRGEFEPFSRVQSLVEAIDDVIWKYINLEFPGLCSRSAGFKNAYEVLEKQGKEQGYLSKAVSSITRWNPYHRLHDLAQLDAYRFALQYHLDRVNKKCYQYKAILSDDRNYRDIVYELDSTEYYSAVSKLIRVVAYVVDNIKWQEKNYSSTRFPKITDIKDSLEFPESCYNTAKSRYAVTQAKDFYEDVGAFSTVRGLRGGSGNSDLAKLIAEGILKNTYLKISTLSKAIAPCVRQLVSKEQQREAHNEQRLFSVRQPLENKITKLQTKLICSEKSVSMLEAQISANEVTLELMNKALRKSMLVDNQSAKSNTM